MKWLKDVQDLKRKEMHCNVCGKKIKIEHGILKEDVFTAKKEWGYFSNKDLQVHSFNVCEKCYNKMVSNFVIPVDISIKGEVI
jgi:Fe2+ or Zn2+ uptake regulation protein